MVEFLDSVSLQKLVDDQLAKGVADRGQARRQAGDLEPAGGQADPRECAELGVRARQRVRQVDHSMSRS